MPVCRQFGCRAMRLPGKSCPRPPRAFVPPLGPLDPTSCSPVVARRMGIQPRFQCIPRTFRGHSKASGLTETTLTSHNCGIKTAGQLSSFRSSSSACSCSHSASRHRQHRCSHSPPAPPPFLPGCPRSSVIFDDCPCAEGRGPGIAGADTEGSANAAEARPRKQ